ncbi:MAG: hypothetical protein HY587_03740 [Candidatus Omnitrophica bacterium]|nr:hypothetical protein [Candidatus Omnitrophota bacterium]
MTNLLSRKKLLLFFAGIVLLGFSGCLREDEIKSSAAKDILLAEASVSERSGIRIVKLKGDPYTIGYQHGYLLRSDMEAQWKHIMELAKSRLPVPILYRLSQWYLKARMDYAYLKMKRHIPKDYIDEMRGLADGSGISIRTIHRAHAIPELFPTLCANGVYYGKAVSDGKLYHLRNLDWSREIGVHDHACVFVVKPVGKNAFVHFGYAGFIGVLSGVNKNGLSVGQIGANTTDAALSGEPMPFLLRRVLEESDSIDDAVSIVKNAKRTNGYNYVFADALNKRAVALETTAAHFAEFMPNDAGEKESPYSFVMEDVLIRADLAFDAGVRTLQTASGGVPKAPGLEPPTGKAYEVRYKKQAQLAEKYYAKLNPEILLGIAKEIAPASNIQSVLFGYPDVWVANAVGNLRAVETDYTHFNIPELLEKK